MAKEVKETSTPEGQAKVAESSNVTAEVAKSPELTQEELKVQLQEALSSNDWKTVTKVSGIIAKQQNAVERAEKEAKEAEVIALCGMVKDVIDSAIESFIVDGTLDKADGVWFSYDFGTEASTIRLLSKQPSTKSSGGSASATKKFAVTTESMVAKYGDEEFKDGMTVSEYYSSTTDGNKRYQLRMKLLKKEGLV